MVAEEEARLFGCPLINVEFGDKSATFYKGAVHFWFRMPVLVSKFESARANNPIW